MSSHWRQSTGLVLRLLDRVAERPVTVGAADAPGAGDGPWVGGTPPGGTFRGSRVGGPLGGAADGVAVTLPARAGSRS